MFNLFRVLFCFQQGLALKPSVELVAVLLRQVGITMPRFSLLSLELAGLLSDADSAPMKSKALSYASILNIKR